MKKQLLTIAVTTVLALGSASAVQAADLKFTPGEDARFTWDSYNTFKDAHDLAGEKLTVFGPFQGEESGYVDTVLAYFNEATGAMAEYSGSGSFEQQIVIDTQAGSAANLAIFPQPGLAADLASKGLLTALGDESSQWMTENYAAGQSWADLGTYANKEGKKEFFAFPYKADLKSLVWYSPENFEDAGYEIPNTMEELKALTDQIVTDGGTPWCIGLGSDSATGWPATDWVEDMMLRTQSPETYDKWVRNEIPFNDPAVVAAIEEFGYFALNDKYVDGGSASVASITFQDSPKGLFQSPPKCYMHRQASFIPAFFPEGTKVGEDADFFYFPAYAGKDLGKPVLGAGTLWAITNDSKGARAFIEFMKTPIAHEIWMAQSGFLSAHKGVNLDAYANESLRKQGEILQNASTFRFDASDLMPGKIGAGAFWTGMVDYVGGKSAADVGKDIQTAWDAIK